MGSECFWYDDIEWYLDPQYTQRYGVVNVGGNRWAVVQDDHSTPHLAVKTLTTVSDKATAVGFIKLLLEK